MHVCSDALRGAGQGANKQPVFELLKSQTEQRGEKRVEVVNESYTLPSEVTETSSSCSSTMVSKVKGGVDSGVKPGTAGALLVVVPGSVEGESGGDSHVLRRLIGLE